MEISECPLCNFMVCTKSIVCKECCSTWYCDKCTGMPDTHYDQLASNTNSKWEFPLSQVLTESNFQERISQFDVPSNLKLAQLIDQLRHREIGDAIGIEDNPENCLVMAAEIGSSLLERVLQLEKENSILQQQTSNLSALVEELKNEVREVREREARHVETINGINRQLERKKASHEHLQQAFEEHDEKQEQLIDEYRCKICKLEKTIENLKDTTNGDNDQSSRNVVDKRVNLSENDKMTSFLCRFEAMESRLSTMEKLIVEDRVDIFILKKTLSASGVETPLNMSNSNQVNTWEQNNDSTQDQFECVSDSSSENITSTKETDDSPQVNKPAKPPTSAMSLKLDEKPQLFNTQIESGVEMADKIDSGWSKDIVIQRENQNCNQPCAVTYLKGKKYILGLNQKKKDNGIRRQGCRIFINPFLNKS